TSGGCLRERLLTMVGEKPAHGYELCDRLQCAAVGTAETVAVYRALRAMERDGVLESRWEDPGSGPARRVYSLSGS
ncbi:MAG TPA: helix-turn-helix transcriptional regulator, partial [Acidimicrobiales bacterium]